MIRTIKALVIEDDPTLAAVLNFGLEARGLSASFAANGDEGIAALQASLFDVVVVDHNAPETDGAEILGWMADRLPYRPHVVVVSDDASDDTRALLTEAGCDAFLAKPVRLLDLDAAISPVVEMRRAASRRHA